MSRLLIAVVATAVALSVVVSGCGQTPAPSPTAAPAAPTAAPAAPAAPKAAEPTKAPTAAPAAPTSAPAAPTAAPTTAPAKKVDYPAAGKAITMLVPYSAGGATDLVARLVAEDLEKALGVAVQVTNRTGAGGQIAATELVQAKPDGYTIMATALPTTIGTYLDPARKAIYTAKDFTMLARITAASVNVAVLANGPYKKLEDLLDAAKANPGKIPFAAGTQLSGYHLSSLQFQKVTKTEFSVVNFDGGAQGVTALLGGHVDVSVNQPGELLQHVQSGDIRLLGVMDSRESSFFPGVPTLESQGYPVYALSQAVMVAPAGTPKEIVDILSGAMEKVTAKDAFVQKARDLGLEVRYLGPSELAKEWAAEEERIAPLIEDVVAKR